MDCRLLADVFENFRATMIKETLLDPANYITLPQFTFAAAFRKTKCALLTDERMYEFFEQGIKGGMSFVNTHHVKANNPETGDLNGNTYISIGMKIIFMETHFVRNYQAQFEWLS